MPLIKIDYDQKLLSNAIDELIDELSKESMRIYDQTEDKVSIFTAPYGEHFFSTAAAEIEIRAKLAEYAQPDQDRNELRLQHIAEFRKFLDDFIARHQLSKGIVFSITFEDWQVEWLPGAV